MPIQWRYDTILGMPIKLDSDMGINLTSEQYLSIIGMSKESKKELLDIVRNLQDFWMSRGYKMSENPADTERFKKIIEIDRQRTEGP